MREKTVIFIVALMCCGMFMACGKQMDLTGQWKNDEYGYMEFFSDGTGTVSDDDVSYTITWIAENERLKISMDTLLGETSVTYGYKLDGDNLILTDDAGEQATYTRL